MFLLQVGNWLVDANMHIAMESDAFCLHLGSTPFNDMLFHFEVGDAIAHQPTGAGVLLKNMNVVTGSCELLGSRHAGWTGSDHSNLFACLCFGWLRYDPAFIESAIGNGAFNRFYCDRFVLKV